MLKEKFMDLDRDNDRIDITHFNFESILYYFVALLYCIIIFDLQIPLG